MILRNVIVPGHGSGDLHVLDGRVQAFDQRPPSDTPRIVMPQLVEAHCHLDKCHTLHRLADVGGDLTSAIAAQLEDKVNWTEADIWARAGRGISELVEAGCGLARSHVDWGNTSAPPLAWSVLEDLCSDRSDEIDLQLAALVNIAALEDPDCAMSIARRIAETGGALGTFLLDHAEPRQSLVNMFDAASRFGIALDFHVDEGLMPGLHGVELIADVALEHGFDGPILCGHACALMNLRRDDFDRVAEKLALAGIFVAALPTTNLYLQGRTEGTPDRRGLTRLRELADAGVQVVVASDNVADAFCPLGQHDPMAALNLAVLTGHLDPPFDRWLPLITTNAASALGQKPPALVGTSIDTLILSDARNLAELVSGRCGPPRRVHTLSEAAQ